uniref:Reverse transcriptase domain-containing protein n=1 Tax=Cuerna arida TaxID=1464854 RepID=A0A1B6H3Y5_9HEMI
MLISRIIRRQCVEVGDIRSDWETVTCGVPQGSILGPLLFVLYVNDITSTLTHCKYHMYADDLQIYAHFSVENINDCITKINEDIDRIVKWTDKHGLRLNHEKTKPIIICSTRLRNSIDFDNINSITVNTTVLPYYDKVKNLGLTINSTLTWGDAVTDIRKKVFGSIHSLKKLQNFLPQHIKLHLVKSLVMPYFTYCSAVINDMTVTLADVLQRSQNYCLRYVYNLRRQEHITAYYLESKLLKLNDQRSIKILSLDFSVLKTGLPKYFCNDFNFVAQGSLRSSRTASFTLRMPHHRTTIYDKAFVVGACRLWNNLPDSIKSLDNHSRFVAALKKLYFERMA